MRFVQTSALASTLVAGVLISGSCAGDGPSTIANNDALVVPTVSDTAASASVAPITTASATLAATMSATASAPPASAPTMMSKPTASGSATTAQTPTSTAPAMSMTAPTASATDDEDEPTMAPDLPEPPVEDCTDIPPTDVEPENADTPCSTWAEWGECTNPNRWLDEFCDASCGRCTPTSTGMSSEPSSSEPAPMMTMMTGGDGPDGTDLGDDNPYGNVEGGTGGHATRYWDCCKASCGWTGKGPRTVVSCDKGDNNIGVSADRNSCEQGGQSGAFTCHRMAPWAHSNQLSYGYAAINGVNCGTCFHIQFDGTGQYDASDPGSKEIQGKSMVVMATNIGGIQQNQFDLLIPGGGVGDFNGCSGQWGVDNSELGAQYGGFLTVCRQSNGDHEAVKQCMRDKCQDIFGTRNLTELYEGCMWFVDWFKVADNPKFNYKQVDCPEELNSKAY